MEEYFLTGQSAQRAVVPMGEEEEEEEEEEKRKKERIVQWILSLSVLPDKAEHQLRLTKQNFSMYLNY
jgi:hypothetical protein